MLTKAEITELMASVADVVRDFVSSATAPLEKRIAEVDGRFTISEKELNARMQELVDNARSRNVRGVPDEMAAMADVFVKGLEAAPVWIPIDAVFGQCRVDGKLVSGQSID